MISNGLFNDNYTTRRLVHQPWDKDICDAITVGAISVKRLQRQNHDMWCYIRRWRTKRRESATGVVSVVKTTVIKPYT